MNSLIMSRRLFLGVLPNSFKTVRNDDSQLPVLKVEDKKFKCTITVTTDSTNSAYFVQNTVIWNDPITKKERLENIVKCYIVDEFDL